MFILPSIANARELGGYVLPDGRRIRHGLLLRGGGLACASDEDIAELSGKYHVAKIFDFRTSMELKQAPDRTVPGAQNIWMPAFDEDMQQMQALSLPHEAYRDLGNWLVRNGRNPMVQSVAREMYTSMVNNDFTQVQYAGFLMNIVSTESGAVYWHCSQGKDRTGLGAALLLCALGADRELIMKDYAISGDYYKEELDSYLCQVSTPEEEAVLRTFVGVNCDYFEAALDWIDRTYGSLMNYLTGPLMIGEDDIRILRERYLE